MLSRQVWDEYGVGCRVGSVDRRVAGEYSDNLGRGDGVHEGAPARRHTYQVAGPHLWEPVEWRSVGQVVCG